MTGSATERLGHEVIGQEIIFHERVVTWDEADKRAGFRLDRRKRWAFIKSCLEGVPDLCECIKWTDECSECCPDLEYWRPSGRGRGCRYCGYTGRARRSSWVPYCSKAQEVAA